MKKKTVILIIVLSLACFACGGTKLIKPGGNAQNFEADKFDCEMQARSYAASFGSPSNRATMATTVGSSMGAGIAEGLISRDVMIRCMEAKGWVRE